MKKLLLICLLALPIVNNLTAQQERGRYERIKTYKIAYLTQRLDLSPKEAQKFWPLYNEFEKNFFDIRVTSMQDQKRKIRESGGIVSLSEKDANEYISFMLDNESKITQLKRDFYVELKDVLSSQKILTLYNAENEFNRKLLSEFRKNKSKPGPK